MLSVLFAERLKLPDLDIAPLTDQPPRLFFAELSLHQMLLAILGPLRIYGQSDAQVIISLLQSYKNLLFCNPAADAEAVLLRHAQAVIEQSAQGDHQALDREAIDQAIQRLNDAISHDAALKKTAVRNPEREILPKPK